MADQIRPTPRSPILGLFSDLVNLPLEYMSAPQRTQQMQGVAEFIRSTGVPSTLERLSYGQGLFTGAGGLGGTTRLRPEAAEAALTVAPMVGPAAKLAGRAIRATEGLPVGMGIRDVGESITQAPSKAIRRFDNGGLEVGYERDGSKLLVTVAPASKNDRMLSASLENIGGYPSGTGDATMAYVDALEAVVRNSRGKPVYWDGFTSESTQSPQAKAIYDRLKAAGIPFEKNVFSDRSKDALSLTQQQLLDIDFDDVRRRLIESAATKSGVGVSPTLEQSMPSALDNPIMYRDPFGSTVR